MAIGMLEYDGQLINTMGIHVAHEDEATPWNEPITNLSLKLRDTRNEPFTRTCCLAW